MQRTQVLYESIQLVYTSSNTISKSSIPSVPAVVVIPHTYPSDRVRGVGRVTSSTLESLNAVALIEVLRRELLLQAHDGYLLLQ